MNHRQSLLFVHIQKTAGMALRTLLFNRFPADGSLYGAHTLDRQKIDPSTFAFVSGHLCFDYVERFRPRPVVLTILRPPLDRALSAYSYFRTKTDKQTQSLNRKLPPEVAARQMRFQDRVKELSLLDLLQKEEEAARHVLWNVQSRVLCGSRKANDPATSPQELLDRARDNLASCDVVGLSGRMNDTLELLADRVGWSGLGPLLWENVTPNRLKRQDIDPRALAILQEWNALDEQLYRHAEEIFASRHGSRSRAAVADVPSAGSFTFEKPIHGYGWHLREQGKNGWFAWTCGNEESWIDLGFAGQGDHVLQVQVDHVLDRSVVRGLEVRLNGHPLQVRRHDVGDGAILDAAVPAALLAGQARVRVGLRTFGSLRPCDLNPASEDTRSMGVAVSCIRLLPAISAASGGRLRRAG